MAIEFSDMTPEGKKFLKELRKLESLEVQVGFQAGEATYDDTGADVAEIAAYNEFGSSGTPARPFMKQSFENHESELQKACDAANQTIAKGGTAEQALNKIGVFCKGLVQQEIVDGGFAPNAESTIAKKGSATPLVDTGLMRQSVNYVVKKRGG